MKIELKSIKVRDLVAGYVNSPDTGVRGYGGRLDIRPPYQREFRYDVAQQQAVVNTIMRGFPLNIMYWSETDGGEYEMIDGQQRTLSICEYYAHGFHVKDAERGALFFGSLTEEERRAFLDYELTVYFCAGTEREKLDWFRVINIAGERLLEQELRNAIYVGAFVSDARRYFSKNGCAAYDMAGKLMNGVPIRQDYLETVLRWASRREGLGIDEYMALHQHDVNASRLWDYFKEVIDWVNRRFTHYRREMKGLDWGLLYQEFGQAYYDPVELEQRIHDLMEDDEIMKKAGIYRYVLSGDERDLSFRAFDMKQKREAYERQGGICPRCGKHFAIEEMEADHITPWREGGTTVADNCQMLCRTCNRVKGAK